MQPHAIVNRKGEIIATFSTLSEAIVALASYAQEEQSRLAVVGLNVPTCSCCH